MEMNDKGEPPPSDNVSCSNYCLILFSSTLTPSTSCSQFWQVKCRQRSLGKGFLPSQLNPGSEKTIGLFPPLPLDVSMMFRAEAAILRPWRRMIKMKEQNNRSTFVPLWYTDFNCSPSDFLSILTLKPGSFYLWFGWFYSKWKGWRHDLRDTKTVNRGKIIWLLDSYTTINFIKEYSDSLKIMHKNAQ